MLKSYVHVYVTTSQNLYRLPALRILSTQRLKQLYSSMIHNWLNWWNTQQTIILNKDCILFWYTLAIICLTIWFEPRIRGGSRRVAIFLQENVLIAFDFIWKALLSDINFATLLNLPLRTSYTLSGYLTYFAKRQSMQIPLTACNRDVTSLLRK